MERLDGRAVHDPGDHGAGFTGRDREHGVVEVRDPARDLAQRDQGLAPAEARHGREIDFVESLGDRRRLFEERERGLGVALLECLECLRDEQVADHSGIESVLVDEPPGSREPPAGDRHLAAVRRHHPEPERDEGRERRIVGLERHPVGAGHERGRRSVVATQVRGQPGLAEISPRPVRRLIGCRERLRSGEPLVARERGPGEFEIGGGRHSGVCSRRHSTASNEGPRSSFSGATAGGYGGVTMAILETHDVGKRYGRRNWAIRHVDIEVPDGSITALVGPNGSGKSTLLKAWVGFERPTEGRLIVDGVDPWRDRAGAIRRIGYVPQSPSLYRELTVDEHVTMARTLRNGFDSALARRRLDDLDIPLEARAGELSGGQQAQVGLALALGARAPVLLLDEPLASLDPLARREFLHVLVDAVRADGATALLSSHVITDIEQACDRLLVLGGGTTLLDVSIGDAIAAHRVVAAAALDTEPPAGDVIGRFPGPAGEPLALVRTATAIGRAATLEEVVLGHLAAGRRQRVVNAGQERAA